MLSKLEEQFPYQAVVPWPDNPTVARQQDWIDSLLLLELWLDSHIGSGQWIFSSTQDQEYYQACIAFQRASDCTMFILRWAN